MSALPATMMCVEIKKPGGPEALVPATRPVPQPKAGELLIKVAATGVNRPDLAQRAGTLSAAAGRVRPARPRGCRHGRRARRRRQRMEGRRCGVRADAGRLLRRILHGARAAMPAAAEGLRHAAAAALPENYFTVWHNLFERGQLKAGEIGADPWRRERHRHDGDPARQGVRRHGVHHRAQRAEGQGGDRLGADHAILYKDNDWAAEVKKLSGSVDVVLDMVAGDYLPKNLGC